MIIEGKVHQVCPHCGADITFDVEVEVDDDYGSMIPNVHDVVTVCSNCNYSSELHIRECKLEVTDSVCRFATKPLIHTKLGDSFFHKINRKVYKVVEIKPWYNRGYIVTLANENDRNDKLKAATMRELPDGCVRLHDSIIVRV